MVLGHDCALGSSVKLLKLSVLKLKSRSIRWHWESLILFKASYTAKLRIHGTEDDILFDQDDEPF